jgi:hypothetical protein
VGHSITLAGRKVACGKADILIDRELPSEGGAGDTTLILNPEMLKQQPPTVRLFVFSHECGHLSVGDSELDADCFAVGRGVREHWLDRRGLDQVCQSFDGAPETDSHPSAKRRCNLNRCFPWRWPNAAGPHRQAPATITATAPATPGAYEQAGGAPRAKMIGLALCRSARRGDRFDRVRGPHRTSSTGCQRSQRCH